MRSSLQLQLILTYIWFRSRKLNIIQHIYLFLINYLSESTLDSPIQPQKTYVEDIAIIQFPTDDDEPIPCNITKATLFSRPWVPNSQPSWNTYQLIWFWKSTDFT